MSSKVGRSSNKDSQDSKKLILDQYQQIAKLGSGTFGNVYKCIDLKSGEVVAIKKLKKVYSSSDDAFNLREVKVLQKLNHPNVVQAKRIELEGGRLYMVFESLDMNLTDFMREKQKTEGRLLSEDEIKVIMKQVLLGVEYLHANGILHRDIKPENFVISMRNYEVKMIDFGTVKDINSDKAPYTTYVSTRWYRAPEMVLRSHNYSTPSDIFAVGCVMAELFTSNPLFPGASELDQLDTILKVLGTPRLDQWKEGYKLAQQRNIDLEQLPYKKKNLTQVIPNASHSALNIITKMLKINSSKRLSAKQLLLDPYFNSFQIKNLVEKIKSLSPPIRTIEVKSEALKANNEQSGKQSSKWPVKPPVQQSQQNQFKLQLQQVENLKQIQQRKQSYQVIQSADLGSPSFGGRSTSFEARKQEVRQVVNQKPEVTNHITKRQVENQSQMTDRTADSQFEYYPNYQERKEQQEKVNYNTSINTQIKTDFQKQKYRNSMPEEITENKKSNEFAKFKIKSLSQEDVQPFPLKRASQPLTFAERVDNELRRSTQIGDSNFQYMIAPLYMQQSTQNSPILNQKSPSMLDKKPDSSQSMLARVASQGIIQNNGIKSRQSINLTVKIDKNMPLTINNSPMFSPLQPMNLKTNIIAQKRDDFNIALEQIGSGKNDKDEQIEPFLLRNDSFGNLSLSQQPSFGSSSKQLQKSESIFNFQSKQDLFSPFYQQQQSSSTTQDGSDLGQDQQNILNKYVAYYQTSQTNNQSRSQGKGSLNAGIFGRSNLEQVEETREEHIQNEFYNKGSYSSKGSNNYQYRTTSEYSRPIGPTKGATIFQNNATNIFSSPSSGLKQILSTQNQSPYGNIKKNQNNNNGDVFGTQNTVSLFQIFNIQHIFLYQNMVDKKEKLIKGIIKAVHSGDYVTISKPSKTGPATEIAAYLASVQAPKIGSSQRVEEPFAFDAREAVRDKIIGKKCEFHTEYNYGGRDYGTLLVNGENINIFIVKQGLAKVIEKKGSLPASRHYDELVTTQQEAKTRKIGVFSTDEKFIEKHTRNVTYFSDPGYSATKLVEEAKGTDKPLEAIVEYVFSASYITVFIHKFQTVAKVSLVHLFTPQNIDKELIAEGKAFTEKLLLHRTVGVKLERLEEGGNLMARIFHPAGDISYEVVKNGFSKLTQPKNIDFDADYYKTLKEAQLIAQAKALRIWKDFKQEEKKQQKPSAGDFMGRVVEVHQGDSLTIERESDFLQIRVFLATVKAPQFMKKPGEEPDPWAWESKEELRKATIGKKVKVEMEFSRTVKAGEQDKNRDYATVVLEKNVKNVSCILLEKGLLKTNVTKSGDNASKHLEDLLASEKKASDARIGMHSSAAAPIRVYNDLVNNPKKSKDFEAMVMKRPNRKMNGVVEYCFSGMRFKVRLDGENTAIAYSLLGVKTLTNDKNQPQLLEWANEAQQFAKDVLFQKEVVVDPEFCDKRGNFFGSLTLKNKKDFGLMLVAEGLAMVSIFGNKVPHNIDEIEKEEAKAKQEQIGIWDKSLKIIQESSSQKEVEYNERTQVLMTDIQDASYFSIRILSDNQYPKVESELQKFDPLRAQDLEKPVKKGTVCAARFKIDLNWYRAKVLRALGKGQFEVQFIDFGNSDTVNGDDMKRLSQNLLAFDAQAKPAQLAYIKAQRIGNEVGDEAAKIVQDFALDKTVDAIVVGQEQDILQVVLFEKGEKDWNKSLNCKLIQKGLAMMRHYEEDDESLPSEINDWYDFEEEAKEQQLKVRQYGNTGDDSD